MGLLSLSLVEDIIGNSSYFNIKNEHAPNYLRELIPPAVQITSIYPLRNGSNLIIPLCRLSITTESFIPSTVKFWNRARSI